MPNPVTDLPLLKRMEADGHIELHAHTGKKVETLYGAKITCWYIQGIKDGGWRFTYNRKSYEEKYVDGSFYPYLVESKN